MTLFYNLLMLAVDVAVVLHIIRHRGTRHWLATMACAAAIAITLGVLLGGIFENYFGVCRLWSHGIFLHGVGLLFASAFIRLERHPLLSVGMGILALTVLVIAIDAFFVEPTWLEVTHRRIESPKITRPLRIVVVADLQTDSIDDYERTVFKRVLDEKPDLILFAGDYLQSLWRREHQMRLELRECLKKLNFDAPLGVYAVRGNVDLGNWQECFEGTAVQTVNLRQTFDFGELKLTCLSLSDSRQRTLKISNPNPKCFHLVLGHIPNFALSTDVDADLIVAGHTHGGQVVIPFLGPVVTHSVIPNDWASGLTELSGGRKLLVSRGIGMEREHAPPMRFLCRPELIVIELVPPNAHTNKSRSKKSPLPPEDG